ncbi:hypothetical protein D3C76_1565470 [compost metagenome]
MSINSGAIVLEADLDMSVLYNRADDDASIGQPCSGDGLQRIGNQVEHHLLDLHLVRRHLALRIEPGFQAHFAVSQVGGAQAHDLCDQAVYLYRQPLQRRLLGENAKRLDNVRGAGAV